MSALLAFVLAFHPVASNHGAGVQWCTCAIEPVPLHLDSWRAVEPVPVVHTGARWAFRAIEPVPAARVRR